MGYKALLFVLFMAFLVRLPGLDSVPAWQWDEGANLNIASNLLQGRAQIFALKHSFMPHPPLFFAASALSMKILGDTILSLRILTVLFGAATAALLYFTGKTLLDEKAALIAGLTYALYPAAVFYSRMGFANNQLVFLSTISFYFTARFIQTRKRTWAYLASLSAGACFTTGFIGIACMASVAYATYLTDKKALPKSLAFMLFLPGVFAAAAYLLMPSEFLGDISYHLDRTIIGSSSDRITLAALLFLMVGGLAHAVRSFFRFIPELNKKLLYAISVSYSFLCLRWMGFDYAVIRLHGVDYLTVFSLLGLIVYPEFLIRDEKSRRALLAFTTFNVCALLAFNRTDHMTMIIYPYMALGLSFMMREMRNIPLAGSKALTVMAAFIIVFHPLIFSAIQDWRLITGQAHLTPRAGDVEAAANYINERSSGADVVLTYSFMGHLLSAQPGIILQGLAYDGFDLSPYYRGDYPLNRWVFNTSLSNARFIVLLDEDLENFEERYGPSYAHLADELSSRSKVYVGGFGVYE